MSRILNFTLFESSIGSEEIRKKWYSKIPKKVFYEIINIDPTSVRKKEFSKPGKFSKWLLMKMIDRETNNLSESGEYFLKNEKEKLSFFLFIFNSGWYRLVCTEATMRDILQFKNINDFMKYMQDFEKSYTLETKSKYDFIYADNKVNIVVPLNFTASFETAKYTDWCTKNIKAWNFWSSVAILFRILPKSKSYSKVKLSWKLTQPYSWTLASEKYPEISGTGNPFSIEDGQENWKTTLDNTIKRSLEDSAQLFSLWTQQGYKEDEIPKKDFKNYEQLERTMGILSDDVKKQIVNHFNKFKK